MKNMFTIEGGVEGVRLAVATDEAALFALAMMQHKEMGIFSYNQQKVIDCIKLCTARQGGIIYVIEEGNHVVASLCLVFSSEWYSDDIFLSERWNFVHPNYRRSNYGRLLLEQAKWTCERFKAIGQNIPVVIGIATLDRTESKVRLYARHLPCVGAVFMYGEPPQPAEKRRYQDELIKVAECTAESRRRNSKTVRPVVETIIRKSRNAMELCDG